MRRFLPCLLLAVVGCDDSYHGAVSVKDEGVVVVVLKAKGAVARLRIEGADMPVFLAGRPEPWVDRLEPGTTVTAIRRTAVYADGHREESWPDLIERLKEASGTLTGSK